MNIVELAQEAVPPLFEFAFSYALPADLLKVKEYNGANIDTTKLSDWARFVWNRFKVEGRHLYTNDGSVLIVYVKDITNPDLWDSLFYQAAAAWLASKLALAIAKDEKRSRELLTMAESVLMPLALAVDGQEMTVQPLIVDDLLWGR